MRQEAGPAAGTAQGHPEDGLGVLAGLRVAGVVAQHAVGRDHVIDVVRALLAAFDLPRDQMRDVQQGLGQHVQREVQTGEEAAVAPLAGIAALGTGTARVAAAVMTVAALFAGLLSGLFGQGRGSGAALAVDAAGKKAAFASLLAVDAAAGLHAAAAQAALAAHVTGPVAAARHAVAQRAVDEAFQIQPFGAGLAHGADLVDGELARQDDAAGAQVPGGLQALRMRDVGQGGEVDLALETGLPRQIQHGQILHDDAVGAHLTGQAMEETVGRRGLLRLDQHVHGHIDAGLFLVGQVGEARKVGKAEVLGLHAGRKVLQAQVHGVGAGGQGRGEALGVTGRGQDLRAFRGGQDDVTHA